MKKSWKEEEERGGLLEEGGGNGSNENMLEKRGNEDRRGPGRNSVHAPYLGCRPPPEKKKTFKYPRQKTQPERRVKKLNENKKKELDTRTINENHKKNQE